MANVNSYQAIKLDHWLLMVSHGYNRWPMIVSAAEEKRSKHKLFKNITYKFSKTLQTVVAAKNKSLNASHVIVSKVIYFPKTLQSR